MTAEEWLKANYSNDNNWDHYPPSERRVAEMLEAYANYKLKWILDNKLSDERIEREIPTLDASEVFDRARDASSLRSFSEWWDLIN